MPSVEPASRLEEMRRERDAKGRSPSHALPGEDSNFEGMAALPSSDKQWTGEQSMSDPPTREEIDAKMAAAEARTDTKLAKLEGKLDLVLTEVRSAKQEAKEDSRTNRNLNIGLAAIIIAVIALIATFGPQMLDLGTRLDERAEQAFERQQKIAEDRDAAVKKAVEKGERRK